MPTVELLHSQPTMCDEDDYSWKHFTEILMILIADTVALPKVKNSGATSVTFSIRSHYTLVSIVDCSFS